LVEAGNHWALVFSESHNSKKELGQGREGKKEKKRKAQGDIFVHTDR
jgi:hypothetical protein